MTQPTVWDAAPEVAEGDEGFVWMIHADGTTPARLPESAREDWEARGWEVCERPVDVDPALAEYQPRVVAEPPPKRRSRKPAVEEPTEELTEEQPTNEDEE
jgi:hypothetical protein